MIRVLWQQWHDLVRTWSIDAALVDETFQDLCQHYAESSRHYHTLAHIQDVLKCVEDLADHAQNIHAVMLAAWLHDAIYDPQAFDNEELSAAYAEKLCQRLSIPDGPLVASLILKTKTHEAGDNLDAQVLLDADLAILGAGESEYRKYAEQIRQEYAWVPEPEYRLGRARVLQRFLARPRIFHLSENLEEPARRNIIAEIGRLGPVPKS
jgi:predicted metal-dependent HD superfamily phosphohydrolase